MIAAITGGRRDERGNVLTPSPRQMERFFTLLARLSPSELRHGNAIGTDRYVAYFTLLQPSLIAVNVVAYPVKAEMDGPWPLAGHNRNYRMLHTHPYAEVLIAFPGGGGTANCVEVGLRMGIEVWQWEGDREKGEFREITRCR